MPRKDRSQIPRTLARWALLSAALSGLLFFSAGTARIRSLQAYLFAFSGLLLITMLVSHPDLVEERFHPAGANLDAGVRFASGFLFLLTLTAAALDVGRLHASDAVPGPMRIAALVTFALATLTQAWAMAVNPFFSPVVRSQSERGHHHSWPLSFHPTSRLPGHAHRSPRERTRYRVLARPDSWTDVFGGNCEASSHRGQLSETQLGRLCHLCALRPVPAGAVDMVILVQEG